MSDIDTSRKAIEALMEGVTEGPWDFDCLEVIGPRRETVADPVTNKDGRFIAASRQLVPALLDRAEKAEEDLVYMAGQSMCESERANEAEAELATLKAERERLRTAFRINALRWKPDLSHEEIDSELDRIALGDA